MKLGISRAIIVFLLGSILSLQSEAMEEGNSPSNLDLAGPSVPNFATPAPIDWAPPYQFPDRKAWALQIKDFRRNFSRNFDHTSPEFQQAIAPIRDSGINLPDTDPLTGIICCRLLARNIGVCPVKETYSRTELDYIEAQMLDLGIIIQGTSKNKGWIPHDLRDITHDDLEKSKRLALSNYYAETTNLNPAKKTAYKKILYARIPWRKLEAISRFAFQASTQQFLADQASIIPANKLLQAGLPQLILDFRILTEAFKDLIHFYQQEKIGNMQWNPPMFSYEFIGINTLGGFSRDKDNLTRIQGILSTLLGKPKAVASSEPLAYPYAVLRALNVIGECSVSLSPQMKSSLLTVNSWQALRDIRNCFHSFETQPRLRKALLAPQAQSILKGILEDLKKLSHQLQTVNPLLNLKTWQDFWLFYNAFPRVDSAISLDAIEDLNNMIFQRLSKQDHSLLLQQVKELITRNNDIKKNLIQKTLLEDLEVTTEQSVFLQGLERMVIPHASAKKLEEAYKKRRLAQKNGENSQITDEKERKKIEATLSSTQASEQILHKIAKNINDYPNWESVKTNLKEAGLKQMNDFTIWEVTFNKRFKITIVPKKTTPTTKGKVELLTHEIFDDLHDLEQLFDPYRKIPITQRAIYYESDVITTLAAEYLIGSFREHAQQLWNILANFERSDLQKVCKLVDSYIQRAKSILHNHDLSDLSGTTALGINGKIITEDIPFLLGSLSNIEFFCPLTSISMTDSSGKEITVPIIDKRMLDDKEAYKRALRKAFNKCPPYSDGLAFSLNWNFKGIGQTSRPASIMYSYLSVEKHNKDLYLLFTPPQQPDNLRDALKELLKIEF